MNQTYHRSLLAGSIHKTYTSGKGASTGSMARAIVALLVLLALGWGQPGSSSCVQVVNNTAGNVSPFTDEASSLTFTMEGVTNFTTSNVSL